MQKLEILSTTSVFYKISSKILLSFPFYLDESVLTIFPNYLERIDIFPIFAAENNRAYVKEMNGKSNLTDEEMKEVMKHFIITKIQSKIPQKTKMECHKKPK